MRIDEIIKRFGLASHGVTAQENLDIQSVAAIDKAGPGQITFFSSPEFAHFLPNLKASALLVRDVNPLFQGIQLVHKDPQFVFAKLGMDFYQPDHGPRGINPNAFVDPSAQLGRDITIHAGVHVEARAAIGDGCILYPGVYVGRDTTIGARTVLHPNVVIYNACIIGDDCLIHAGSIIGADGFGFSVSGGEICKIPQVGIVRIGNNVELGALCTVDRAANDETVIHDNCKFDDRVHIAHNCEIGANSMFSAQVGIAGSTKIGKWNLIGGQSGVADHLTTVDGVRMGARTAVLSNIAKRDTYAGYPAIPVSEWKRQVVYLKRLKDYDQTIKSLEKRLADLEERLSE